jgi:hypothetical protein
VLGRLGERSSTERAPGVRRIVVHESTDDRGQTKQQKVDCVLRKAERSLEGISGERARSENMLSKTKLAIGHLGR